MKNLYVDIDGVLLTKRDTRIADFGVEFIDFITTHFDCYWLTTHCKGHTDTALKYLSKYYDTNSLDRLSNRKVTDWQTLKTEGIDLLSDFYWIDDAPFESEKKQLIQNQALDRLIVVDLNKENELKRLKDQLLSLAMPITKPKMGIDDPRRQSTL